MRHSCLALVLFILAGPTLTPAARADTETAPETKSHQENVTELFVGGAYKDGESGVAIGLTHEYRFHRYLGVGAFAEYATKELDEWSFGIPLFLHPWRGLRIQAAPGLELKHGETEFLFRVGMGYEIELSERWRLLPEMNVDFVDGERVILYGASFGYAW